MVRFLLVFLAFYLLFLVIRGVVRSFMPSGRRQRPESFEAPGQPPRQRPPEYRDVKDATFKDLPDDQRKAS